MSVLKGYIFTTTYTTTDFISTFKTDFPEFATVTNAQLNYFINIACDVLPDGLPDYFDNDVMINMLLNAVAHFCTYFDIINATGEVKTVLKNASAMAADGLNISYAEVAKLRGEFFNSLNDFFNATAYGRIVCLYLGKINGSVGGFVI